MNLDLGDMDRDTLQFFLNEFMRLKAANCSPVRIRRPLNPDAISPDFYAPFDSESGRTANEEWVAFLCGAQFALQASWIVNRTKRGAKS